MMDLLEQALDYLLENDQIARQIGNHYGLVLTPKSIGDVYLAMRDFDRSEEVRAVLSMHCL
jgi:hypothetical protein